MYKKFIFISDFKCKFGQIKAGSTLTVLKDIIYFNDGQITPVHYNIFHELINDELQTNSHKVLKEIPIPYNKL